tara:strand:- start:68 stop:295 length:228 start_codon:yes stop_codon:yes gene_type:complete
MNLQEAKEFLRTLWNDGLMYHLDDDAEDCLRNATTPQKAKAIQKAVDEIYEAELDWGIYDCPIGYCLQLIAMEKD